MRALFIYPNTRNEILDIVRTQKEPLGICYLSAYLKRKGHISKVIHQLDLSDDDLLKKVKEFHPEIVGFSTFTYNFKKGKDLALRIKSEYKDVPIVFGGYHVSALPSESVRESAIDFVVVGEGEKTIEDLIRTIKNGGNLEDVRGIAYKKNGEVKMTPPAIPIDNLDSLPFPDRDDLPMEKYKATSLQHPPNAILGTMHTSRGCRYRCKFCATPTVWPGKWRARSPENVVNEIEELIDNYHVQLIFFADEDFLADKKRVYEICAEIKKRNVKIQWRCFAKVTDVDRGILLSMKNAGCIGPFFGIESLNTRILGEMGKGITIENIKKAIGISNEIGMITYGSYMVGYPWETVEELKSAFDKLSELPLDYFYLPFLTAFPGTKFYEYCENNDLLRTRDFEHFDCNGPTIKCPIPDEKLIIMRREFEKSFYSSRHYYKLMSRKVQLRPELGNAYKNFFINIGKEFEYKDNALVNNSAQID